MQTKNIFQKLLAVIKRPVCVGVFVASIIIFAFLFVALPAYYIPNNSVSFQISTYSWEDYLLLALLAVLSALSLTVQIYKWKNPSKTCKPALPIYGSSSTVFAAIFAAIVGTATCTACVAPIVALFGLGLSGAIFLVKYKFAISFVAILVILTSIYFSLRND